MQSPFGRPGCRRGRRGITYGSGYNSLRRMGGPMKCPHSRRVSVEHHHAGLKTYCQGDSLKGLELDTLFEATHDCTTLQIPACRVLQARQGATAYAKAP